MHKRKTLEDWIRDAMNDPDKEGKLSVLSLVHMVGQQQQELHAVKFGSKQYDPKQLADMFRGKAESFSQDLQSVQTFSLLAFYGDSREPQGMQPFMVNPETNHSGLFTEPPTEMGRMQQRMRHDEMLIQQVYRRQQAQDEFSIRMMHEMSTNIRTLMQENRDALNIVKEVMMEKISNDREFEMKKLEYIRNSEERKRWLAYAPPLINTILGREIFPQNSADTALIESIAEKLTEEQITQLAGVLPPEMWGPVASRFKDAIEKKEKEKTQSKALANWASNHPDPEADAAGEIAMKRLPFNGTNSHKED